MEEEINGLVALNFRVYQKSSRFSFRCLSRMASTLTFSFPWSKSGRTVENTLSGRLKVTKKDNQGYVYVA